MTKALLTACACLAVSAILCGGAGYSADEQVLIHRPVMNASDDTAEIVVARRTTVHGDPGPSKDATIWRLEDRVTVSLVSEGADAEGADGGVELWSRSYTSLRDAVQRCDRLIVYDVSYEGHEAWVLYSIGCEIRIDLISMDGDGRPVSVQTTDVVTQVDSGALPYLIDAGRIMRDDDGTFVVFRTFGSTSTLRGRDHPYEVWVIEGDAAEEVEDILGHHRMQNFDLDQLHDGLPTYPEQIQRPAIPEAAD